MRAIAFAMASVLMLTQRALAELTVQQAIKQKCTNNQFYDVITYTCRNCPSTGGVNQIQSADGKSCQCPENYIASNETVFQA